MSDENDTPPSDAAAPPPNHVHAEFGCPKCGETDVDRLVIDPETEEHVDCASCGHRYELRDGPPPPPLAN